MTTAPPDTRPTVLVVEDDPHTAEIVRLYLKRDGYDVIVAADGPQGLKLARERKPALVVLDLMLPGMDGYEICRSLRAEADSVPVIMLTARVEEDDRLAGLDLGADDYVTKPFSPRELAARVRAVLRRAGRDHAENGGEVLTHGDLTVELGRHRVSAHGRDVRLTPTEFRLLVFLMRSPGQVIPRERIIERIFGYDFDGLDRTLDTHLSNLRRKLELDVPGKKFIETVYGVGYRFALGA
jgi:DNA-binding response OmpR family regulator